MAGSSRDAPIPPMIAQKTMIAEQVLGERHGGRTYRVAEQAEHVRAFTSEEIADLAADQDERGRYQCLECDCRLHAAHRRVEIPDDRGDGHIHDRGVDDQYEHGHRQQDGEPPIQGVSSVALTRSASVT
jgi:hypothetical protein